MTTSAPPATSTTTRRVSALYLAALGFVQCHRRRDVRRIFD